MDEKYDELPSHIRVVSGADLEYKCNKIVGEEMTAGYLLFKTSCGMCYSEGNDQEHFIIVLAFRRMDEHEKQKRTVINRVEQH